MGGRGGGGGGVHKSTFHYLFQIIYKILLEFYISCSLFQNVLM